ncbi:MAG: HAD-IA family hydrolase [Chloroflexi bacterium]|nr:HAD-IA family hydrolase [Chloroflexota bacterium]
MIQAIIFDLDGTLVQTEKLKALSYARAAVQLCPYHLQENDVIEAFKDVVGLSRRTVAMALVDRFDLAEKALSKMAEFGVGTAWQAYVQLRLNLYEEMLADPDVICRYQWPHNMTLLQTARRVCPYVGLATMSYCVQVQRVLRILELDTTFDFVASRDDVEHGKPDPEIYHLVADELGVTPAECLVIEDSPTGVQAALAAGMTVLAVSTPFTRKRLHGSGLLPEARIVDEPERVAAVAAEIVRLS